MKKLTKKQKSNHEKMHKIPISYADTEQSLVFNDIIKNRLRTQDRNGSDTGNLFFYPTILCTMLGQYEETLKIKQTAFSNWLEKSLQMVYFESEEGEKIYLKEVKEIILFPAEKTLVHDQLSCNGIKLTDFLSVDTHSTLMNNGMYEVRVILAKNSDDKDDIRVSVGTKDNMVKNISDLTIDHVYPIKKILTQNAPKIPYILALDRLIRASVFRKKSSLRTRIPELIDYNDKDAYEGLVKDLDYILKKSKGLRMIASVMN